MDRFFHDHAAPLAATPSEDGGARGRDSLFMMAQLRFEGERATRDVRMRNLSAGGLMVDCARVKEPGTAVELELRGIGQVTGKVAWCTEGRIGIALDRQIDPRLARIGANKREG